MDAENQDQKNENEQLKNRIKKLEEDVLLLNEKAKKYLSIAKAYKKQYNYAMKSIDKLEIYLDDMNDAVGSY